MKLKTALLAAACTVFSFTHAHAILELRLNTNTKEFAIFGSDTGTPGSFGSAGLISFLSGPIGGSGSSTITYDNDIAYSTSVGTPGNNNIGFDIRLLSTTSSSGRFILQFGTSSFASQTITGSEAFQSYGSMSASAMARLEGIVGQSLPLDLGTGFSSVPVTAVPEPSTYAALAGALCIGLALWRRQRKA